MEEILFILFVICSILCFCSYALHKIFKYPKTGCLTIVNGGVKTGKSTFSVALAKRKYNAAILFWKIDCLKAKYKKKELPEKPLLYSNIPLSIPYVPITRDLLLRKKRFAYRSVVYLCEASLVADSQLIKDIDINNLLHLFFKLIGHETCGGSLIVDTQSISDLHYSCKRCLSHCLYIHHLVKVFPFFLVAYVREERYSEDGLSVNTYDGDIEESLTRVLIPKRTWKIFDAYCYSSFTDDLEKVDNVVKAEKHNLKVESADDLVSFRPWQRYIKLKEKKINEKTDN